MTCIVGIEKGNAVWLGGDRAATDGAMNRRIIKEPKIFTRGDLGFGVCGLPKIIDALAHVIEMPVQKKGTDRAFLAGKLVPTLRQGLKDLDCTIDDEQHGTCFQGSVLLAYRGRLYEMQGNFQLVSSQRGYCSIGSGAPFAIGSLAETWRMDHPRRRVLAALQAAADANASVAPPFDVLMIGKKK